MTDNNMFGEFETLEDDDISSLDGESLTVLNIDDNIVTIEENKQSFGKRKLFCAITVLLCLIGTTSILILFSRPNYHKNIDAFFKGIIDYFLELSLTPWILVPFVVALFFFILTIVFLSKIDKSARRMPSGSFLYKRVGLCFENHIALRFLPAFITMVYFICGGVMAFFEKEISFNPQSYFPIPILNGSGELLNFIYVTLCAFSLFLVAAEGIISSCPIGAVLHIPAVMVANIFLILAGVTIAFVFINLISALFQIAAAVLVIFVVILVGIKRK